jgi:hypothetical protein
MQEMCEDQPKEWLFHMGTGSAVRADDEGMVNSITDPCMPLLEKEVVCDRFTHLQLLSRLEA